MHVESVEAQTSSHWYSVEIKSGVTSGVVLVTWPCFKITRSVVKNSRVAEQCDVNIGSLTHPAKIVLISQVRTFRHTPGIISDQPIADEPLAKNVKQDLFLQTNVLKRKLDEAGASEINRLYPESRRKDEKKDQYLKSFPPQGEAGGREWPNEDETGVTSRGREWKSAGRGA
ncbi:hypothetical protein TNCV_1109951 [Trichonephila clavipes]|nr:hypothetical protein TNCV_1109951 [Trichonephila clavipes]